MIPDWSVKTGNWRRSFSDWKSRPQRELIDSGGENDALMRCFMAYRMPLQTVVTIVLGDNLPSFSVWFSFPKTRNMCSFNTLREIQRSNSHKIVPYDIMFANQMHNITWTLTRPIFESFLYRKCSQTRLISDISFRWWLWLM